MWRVPRSIFDRALQIALLQFSEADYPQGHDELASVWRDVGRVKRAQGGKLVKKRFISLSECSKLSITLL